MCPNMYVCMRRYLSGLKASVLLTLPESQMLNLFSDIRLSSSVSLTLDLLLLSLWMSSMKKAQKIWLLELCIELWTGVFLLWFVFSVVVLLVPVSFMGQCLATNVLCVCRWPAYGFVNTRRCERLDTVV